MESDTPMDTRTLLVNRPHGHPLEDIQKLLKIPEDKKQIILILPLESGDDHSQPSCVNPEHSTDVNCERHCTESVQGTHENCEQHCTKSEPVTSEKCEQNCTKSEQVTPEKCEQHCTKSAQGTPKNCEEHCTKSTQGTPENCEQHSTNTEQWMPESFPASVITTGDTQESITLEQLLPSLARRKATRKEPKQDLANGSHQQLAITSDPIPNVSAKMKDATVIHEEKYNPISTQLTPTRYYSIEEKMYLVEEARLKGMRPTAAEYEISTSTLHIWKKKDFSKMDPTTGCLPKSERPESYSKDFDNEIKAWLLSQKMKQIPVNANKLHEHAKHLVETKYKDLSYGASRIWAWKYYKRNKYIQGTSQDNSQPWIKSEQGRATSSLSPHLEQAIAENAPSPHTNHS